MKRNRDSMANNFSEVCKNYNAGKCTQRNCMRAHVCELCLKPGHTKDNCWYKGGTGPEQGKNKGKAKGGKGKKKKGGK